MQMQALTLTSLVALAFLAGCSDAPPAGDLVAAGTTLPYEGTATNAYQAASSPDPTGNGLCAPPAVPVDELHCVDAKTTITVHLMELPEPDGNGYAVVLTGASGEKNLGNLVPATGGMYDFSYEIDEDYSTMYDTIQVRMGDFLYATAPAAEGAQVFSLAPGVNGVTATGSYDGKMLDVDVQGLPEGSSYTGRLYILGEDGVLNNVATFDLAPGANHYEDEDRNIGDYAEFHIHVGNSKINLYKATIG